MSQTGGLGTVRGSRWHQELPRSNVSVRLGRQATFACQWRALVGWHGAQQQPTALASPAVPGAVRRATAVRAATAAAPPGLSHREEREEREQQYQLQQDQGEEGPGLPQTPPQWSPPVGRSGLYDASGRLVLKSLTLPELEAWCAAEGEEAPANRALQLWRWMYADPPAGFWLRRLEDTLGRQNGFSAKFVDKVGSRVSLDGGLQLSQVVRAADGTRKLVFNLTEGEAAGGSIETVLIPIVRQQGLRDRLTICVSSQVGCAMNCQFCYTGRMGLLGNLTTAQIVEQVVEARRFLAQEGERTQLTNLVFMGMGEPLHNTEAVLAAADIVSHYLGLHISHNKITISTVGLVPEMRSVLARSRVQMALSLHATTDEVRDWIVPVNRRYDLATLISALEELFPKQQQQQQQPQPQSQSQATATTGSSDLTQPHPQHQNQLQQQQGGAEGRTEPGPEAEAAEEGRWLPPMGPTTTTTTSPRPSAAAQEAQPSQQPEHAVVPNDSSSSSDAPAGSASGSQPGTSSSWSAAAGTGAGTAAGTATEATTRGGSAAASSSGNSVFSSNGRSLLVEYTMLHGINDTLEDAQRLASMLARVNCKVNLIVFNPHAGTRFRPSSDAVVSAFRSALVQRGLVCTIRDSRGDDEMAACGQLGNVGLAFRPSPILEAPERFRPFLLPAAAGAAPAAAAEAATTTGV